MNKNKIKKELKRLKKELKYTTDLVYCESNGLNKRLNDYKRRTERNENVCYTLFTILISALVIAAVCLFVDDCNDDNRFQNIEQDVYNLELSKTEMIEVQRADYFYFDEKIKSLEERLDCNRSLGGHEEGVNEGFPNE